MAKEDPHMYEGSLEFLHDPRGHRMCTTGTYVVNADPERLFFWSLETECSLGWREADRRTR